jgi:PKD repeat protein
MSSGPTVVDVTATSQGPSVLRADHVTIAGAGGAAQRGVRVTTDAASELASAELEDSIVAGVGVPFSRSAVVGAQSLIGAERVARGGGSSEATGPGATADTTPLPEPAFADADYRLPAGSPLIDVADPPSGDESPTDLTGGPRSLDGTGDCAAAPDIGAREFAPATVYARATAPAQATAGQAVAFSATGTCDADPSAALTYTWAFDDGTTATGATVEHAFATAGAHTGTLTVTGGGAGRTGTASATVTVSGGITADRRAPRLSKLRRVKGAKRPTLRFTLDEAATVAVRIQRCKAARGACRPAKRSVRARWAAKPGTNTRALPKRLKRPSRYRVRLVAVDRAGNRAAARTSVVRVRR